MTPINIGPESLLLCLQRLQKKLTKSSVHGKSPATKGNYTGTMMFMSLYIPFPACVKVSCTHYNVKNVDLCLNLKKTGNHEAIPYTKVHIIHLKPFTDMTTECGY